MGRTKDFAEVIRRKLASNPDLAAAVNDEYARANVAEQIYAARKKAGLTQAELAGICGMKQSAIARLEAADYEGHKLATVRRIACALKLRMEVLLVPVVEDCRYSASETFSTGWHAAWHWPSMTSLPRIETEELAQTG